MKKLLTILLAICFLTPAFAADVRKVSNDAWLEHMTQMQALRQQIMSYLTKSNMTFEDRDQLSALKSEFSYKKEAWEKYLQEVAEGKAPQPQIEEKKSECTDKVKDASCGKHREHRKYKHSCKKHECGDKKIECKDSEKKCGSKKYECRKMKHKCGHKKHECKDIASKCSEGKKECMDKCSDKKACCGKEGCNCKDNAGKCSEGKKECMDKCSDKKACCGKEGCKDNAGKCSEGKTFKKAKCCK